MYIFEKCGTTYKVIRYSYCEQYHGESDIMQFRLSLAFCLYFNWHDIIIIPVLACGYLRGTVQQIAPRWVLSPHRGAIPCSVWWTCHRALCEYLNKMLILWKMLTVVHNLYIKIYVQLFYNWPLYITGDTIICGEDFRCPRSWIFIWLSTIYPLAFLASMCVYQ